MGESVSNLPILTIDCVATKAKIIEKYGNMVKCWEAYPSVLKYGSFTAILNAGWWPVNTVDKPGSSFQAQLAGLKLAGVLVEKEQEQIDQDVMV